MTKNELLQRIIDENLQLGDYDLEFEKITDASYVMGCCYEDGAWKIFKTKERSGHYIIKEFTNESDAFDYFYELVLIQHRYRNGE